MRDISIKASSQSCVSVLSVLYCAANMSTAKQQERRTYSAVKCYLAALLLRIAMHARAGQSAIVSGGHGNERQR